MRALPPLLLQVYGWSDSQVELLPNIAGIVYVFTVPLWSWLLCDERGGARVVVVLGAVCCLATAALRLISGLASAGDHLHYGLALSAMVFNGLAASPMGATTRIL